MGRRHNGWRQGPPQDESQFIAWPYMSVWELSTLLKGNLSSALKMSWLFALLPAQLPCFVCTGAWTENPLILSQAPHRLGNWQYKQRSVTVTTMGRFAGLKVNILLKGDIFFKVWVRIRCMWRFAFIQVIQVHHHVAEKGSRWSYWTKALTKGCYWGFCLLNNCWSMARRNHMVGVLIPWLVKSHIVQVYKQVNTPLCLALHPCVIGIWKNTDLT